MMDPLGTRDRPIMTPPVLTSKRLTIRPVTETDIEPLVEIIATPGVREWWPSADEPGRVREELRSDERYKTFAIEVDGALAGWLGVEEEDDPDHRSAALDIILAPDYQGRGLGPEALRTMIRWLVDERGHHRFTIDPAVGNERAIRAYTAVGFKPVGVLRRSERQRDGGWRDSLLMDLLADELD
jgi:aminoglycoside 6'-N-acetyltransferase